jgi:outer membrane protein assembly factor BamB
VANKKLLGYLGPIIVIVGAAVAVLGAWYAKHARPVPGDVIDTIPAGGTRAFVVRAEKGGPRSFLELRDGDAVKWQALIPPYAGEKGRPAIAWSARAVTVRVTRDGRAEVFGFALDTASKIGAFRLATEREPIRTQARGPITLTDHVRSYELVGGEDWNQIIAVDLDTGTGVWKVDLGQGTITAGGVSGDIVWLEQDGRRVQLEAKTGRAKDPEHAIN